MTTPNEKSHPFWSGFAMGTLVGGGLMYLIGTKKGRETAQKVLENTENFEDSIQQILTYLRDNDIFSKESTGENSSNIENVIDKVSSFVNNAQNNSKNKK